MVAELYLLRHGFLETVPKVTLKNVLIWQILRFNLPNFPMKQVTFADAEYVGKRKQTCKALILTRMEHLALWRGLIALIEPHYPKNEDGRPAYLLAAPDSKTYRA